MKTNPLKLCLLVLATLTLGVGCTRTDSYEIVVRNQSTTPIVAWLTKNGPPYDERGWKSPEMMAISNKPMPGDQIPGISLKPGEVVSAGPIKGTFENKVDAVLRIYAHAQTMSEILAISDKSTDRQDIILHPGSNEVIIHNDDFGALKAVLVPHEKSGK